MHRANSDCVNRQGSTSAPTFDQSANGALKSTISLSAVVLRTSQGNPARCRAAHSLRNDPASRDREA
jgi:hypothetical protein